MLSLKTVRVLRFSDDNSFLKLLNANLVVALITDERFYLCKLRASVKNILFFTNSATHLFEINQMSISTANKNFLLSYETS